MNDEFLYPICAILYKTENSDGWYYVIMSGEENECRKRCDEIKKKNNWCDYECYVSSRCVLKKDIPFQNTMPKANYIHRATDLIYNPFDNKFYYSKETMPYPKIKKVLIYANGQVESKYTTKETPYLKIAVYDKYSWESRDYKETKDITIEQAISKTILYVIKKIDKLKKERLEKERQDKIRECRQRQIQTYNPFIKEQENIRQEYIKYENYKRRKLLEDSKKWKELCIVKEFLDYIKNNNDASDNEWLDWAYSYLNDINPTNNKYFRN